MTYKVWIEIEEVTEQNLVGYGNSNVVTRYRLPAIISAIITFVVRLLPLGKNKFRRFQNSE
jgi:hypothetical protein